MGPSPASSTRPRRTVVIGVLAAVIVVMLAVLTVVILNKPAQDGNGTAASGGAPVAQQPPLYVSVEPRAMVCCTFSSACWWRPITTKPWHPSRRVRLR